MSQRQPFIFAKKFRLPSPAANIIQTLNMAWGFQDAGVDVRLFPGRKRRDPQSLMATVEDQYMLDKTARPRITFLPGSHKGIYGLLFRSFLVKEWLTNPHGIFFLRCYGNAFFASLGTPQAGAPKNYL
jgi:hypothetical protein